MEAHGNNHRQKVFAIIPARYESTRLAGKLLLEIAGKPLILHTLEQAKKAKNINETIVATDDQRILQVIEESGNRAVLTSVDHQSGSDRVAEVGGDSDQEISEPRVTARQGKHVLAVSAAIWCESSA